MARTSKANESKRSVGMTYGQLKLRSDEYCPELWEKLDDLYTGGFQIESRASKYIPSLIGERINRHKERLQSAAYINYFGEIVGYFISALFTQELSVTEGADSDNPRTPGGEVTPGLYGEFAKNADGKGSPLQKVLRDLLRTAAIKKRALLMVDMPARPADAKIASRADEERLGLDRVWCTELPLESLIDWECDDQGELLWAIVNRIECKRRTPRDYRNQVVETFKVWERDEDSGQVSWALYRAAYPKGKRPKDNDKVDQVDAGTVSFKRIPILELCLPDDLWIGNKIGPGAIEHYQRRTSLNAAENKSLVSLPVYKKGPQVGAVGGAVPSPQQRNPAAGRDPVGKFTAMGFVEIGKDDAIEFAEPHGRCYELVDKQLDKLKDELFRVTHQMAMSVGNDAGSTRRSGESKKQDRSDIGIVLGAFGSEVRSFALKLYDTIAGARGDDVEWTAHGLDDYDTEDRAELLAEALQLNDLKIPSVTFRRLHTTRVALRIVRNAPPVTQDQIRKEIQDNISEESVTSAAPTATGGDGEPGADEAAGTAPPGALGGTEPGSDGKAPPPAASAAPGGAGPAGAKAAPKAARPTVGQPGKVAPKPTPAPAAKPGVSLAANGDAVATPGIRHRADDPGAGIAETVYSMLKQDYDEEHLAWVRAAKWSGPVVVPLGEIDFSTQEIWSASKDPDHVQDFVQQIDDDGFVKPIILVNEPNNEKLIIADGHHRALAYQTLGRDPVAYIAEVGAVGDKGLPGGWQAMHDEQGGSDQLTSRQKKS